MKVYTRWWEASPTLQFNIPRQRVSSGKMEAPLDKNQELESVGEAGFSVQSGGAQAPPVHRDFFVTLQPHALI